MPSHFHCCNNLVNMIVTIFFCFFFLSGSPASAAGRETNPLVELSSRDELVRMAGYGEEKFSTIHISGALYCHEPNCHPEKAPTDPTPVSGALVAFSCHTSGKASKSNRVEVTTNDIGYFLIDLPSHFHAIPNLEKICVVKVLRLPKDSLCRPAFTGNQTELKLFSSRNGFRIFTAGSLNLRPKLHKCARRQKTATE